MLGVATTAARGSFAACMLYVVGNAIADALADGRWLLALAEAAAFPITFLVYPPLGADDGSAWPLGTGMALVVALGVGLLAYSFLFTVDRRETPPGAW